MTESTAQPTREINEPLFKKNQYFNLKNGWVILKGSKKKLKLRKYISDLAYKLNNFNELGYKPNRDGLIIAFDDKQLEGVNKYYQDQVQDFIKAQQCK